MAGQGAKLQSAWAWGGYGIHLPRKALEYGDTDDVERTIWTDWFFEAAPPPPSGVGFARLVFSEFPFFRGPILL